MITLWVKRPVDDLAHDDEVGADEDEDHENAGDKAQAKRTMVRYQRMMRLMATGKWQHSPGRRGS